MQKRSTPLPYGDENRAFGEYPSCRYGLNQKYRLDPARRSQQNGGFDKSHRQCLHTNVFHHASVLE
ncbi:Uncharacterised protein [Vibrio cholerae]|nr:Uncharacterised protein [Vibrio cholerae]